MFREVLSLAEKKKASRKAGWKNFWLDPIFGLELARGLSLSAFLRLALGNFSKVT